MKARDFIEKEKRECEPCQAFYVHHRTALCDLTCIFKHPQKTQLNVPRQKRTQTVVREAPALGDNYAGESRTDRSPRKRQEMPSAEAQVKERVHRVQTIPQGLLKAE